MSNRLPPEMLRQLRNQIPIAILIEKFLKLPTKVSEGYLRFLCPLCSEFVTATNPKTNLARCFRCEKNFNPIDMVMVVKQVSFRSAVDYLSNIKTV
jgi:DNA primase